MNVTIDGVPFRAPDHCSDRTALWNALEAEAERRGRVIVDVLSDGEALSLEDLLTVPEEIDLQVETDTPYGVGLQLLQLLVAEVQDVDSAAKQGQLTVAQLQDMVIFSRSAVDRLGLCFPEWLAADEMNDALSVLEKLVHRWDGDFPPAEQLAPALDDWSVALVKGVEEMNGYRDTDAYDDEPEGGDCREEER